MSEYLNSAMKEAVLCIAGCKGYMDVLSEDTPRKLLPVRKYIRTIRTLCDKLLECAEAGIDEDQLVNLIRFTNNCELKVIPRSSSIARGQQVLIDINDVEYILRNSFSDCGVCVKSTAEVKQCELKKRLLRCGVLPREGGRGVCPFQQ